MQIENDNVDTHGIEYGLKKLHPEKEINAAVRVETCNGCRFNVVFFKALCDKIKATGGGNPVKSQDTIKDALMVVSDIQQKLELYRAHRVRVANQQKAIYKIEEEMKQECLANKISSKHALVVIDWKIKFESMSTRETSHIAWHGCLLKFFRYEEGSAVRYNIYTDQIMEGSNKQDSLAVASMIEAFLYQIHEELSFLEEITLQSDNAGCYQSKDLLLAIALISALSPIKVTRFIHTETQDGKGDIDAHFARSMAHLVSFMHTSHSNKIKRIVTAKGLAAALAWGTEISSLLQKQKSGRTRKKSKFSTTFTECIKNIFDQVLEQKDHQLDRIKPKEILAIVKQHFMEEDGSIPLDFPSDKYITAKVSNLKSMAKKEGHRNIMLC